MREGRPSGATQRLTSELPFSQILDGLSETSGETSARASLRLTGLEVHVGSESEPDNERLVSLRLYISAFAVLREVRSVCCIADLYSTLYDLTVRSENVELSDDPALFTREQSVREKIETGAEVQSILSADVSFGEAGISGSGNDAELRTSANLRVLYLDENGTPLLSERRIDVLLPTDLPVSGRVRLQGVSAGDISASVSDGGVELKYTAAMNAKEEAAFRIDYTLTGNSSRMTVKGAVQVRNVCDVTFDAAVSVRTTSEKPLAAPPAGTTIVTVPTVMPIAA